MSIELTVQSSLALHPYHLFQWHHHKSLHDEHHANAYGAALKMSKIISYIIELLIEMTLLPAAIACHKRETKHGLLRSELSICRFQQQNNVH